MRLAHDCVRGVLQSQGEVLASFQATHLRLPELLATYLVLDAWVVKVDVNVVAPRAYAPPDPGELVVVHGPLQHFRLESRPARTEPLDLEDIGNRVRGWTWYTYSKIGRGELFEAARSIDFTREHAVLPPLLESKKLPRQGHRRIEQRLPASVLERLRESYPRELERDELLRALRALTAFFADFLERRPPDSVSARSAARIRRILAVIDAARY